MRTVLPLALAAVLLAPGGGDAASYYVRQTVGKDTNDGRTPATAWEHVSQLSVAMRAGDTAFVGPGLYREQVTVMSDGTPEARVAFVADATGQHTGDPPGTVLLAGADQVDESMFAATDAPGVFRATFPGAAVHGVVEMDGPQSRYLRVTISSEFHQEHRAPLEIVAEKPASFHFDEATGVLTLHTSDGKPPATHELELLRRQAGFYLQGRHHVTITGFTFRNMQDAGISFFKGTSDAAAIDNVAWGSRQGIRVYDADDVLLSGNTLLRNENSGAYFAAGSNAGVAIGNVAYENVKGLRWSSQSTGALVVDNRLFDNSERGLALEQADRALVRRNVLANNAVSQLLVLESEYTSEDNCFVTGTDQLVADFTPFPFSDRFPTLAGYQAARRRDTHSRADDCGPLPAKLDVRRIHAETTAYAERARAILRGEAPPPAPAPRRSWLDWLGGR